MSEKYTIAELEDILIERKRKPKEKSKIPSLGNLKVMDYIVFISIFSIIGFTIISLYFYYKYGIPVSEIKTELFYFFGAELLGMAGISISNNLGKKKEESDD